MASREDLIKEWGRGSLAEKIAAKIGERIVSGKYPQHDSLPPVTSFVKEFDVHRNTIGNAKRILGDEKFLTKIDGKHSGGVDGVIVSRVA